MTTITTKYNAFLLFFLAFLILGTSLNAQKRALGKPKAFLRPLSAKDFYLNPTKEKEKVPWIVICDSENAQTFEKVNKSGTLEIPKTQLKFRDWFYVADETDCCIQIFKGKVHYSSFKIEGNLENYGWIEKQNVLLWTSSLVDPITGVKLKAFPINKPQDIAQVVQHNSKPFIKTYNGTNTSEIAKKIHAYDIYFILKKEGDKYLLSKNDHINPAINPENLIGWVKQERVKTWNNRICIEPNFQEKAFLERKQNPNFQFIAYHNEEDAISHSKTGQRLDNQAIWKNDPVTLSRYQLSSDAKHFEGNVMRFPMLSYPKDATSIKLGIIGTLHTQDSTSIEDINPQDFVPSATNILLNVVEKNEPEGITNEDLNKIIKDGYKIYTEAFIPKKIKDAKYNTYSLVLMMSEDELKRYIEGTDNLGMDLIKSEKELRKGVYHSLNMLMQQYTNYTPSSKKFFNNYHLSDLRIAMQGVDSDLITYDKNKDFIIENVLNKNKMSGEEVSEFARNLADKGKKLNKILKEGKKYEFSYSSKNNTYYWIPIEYTF